MNCRDKWQSKLNINMKCFNIAMLPSGKLFSKNCGEKILYRPSAIFSLNWQTVFREYFARKKSFEKMVSSCLLDDMVQLWTKFEQVIMTW